MLVRFRCEEHSWAGQGHILASAKLGWNEMVNRAWVWHEAQSNSESRKVVTVGTDDAEFRGEIERIFPDLKNPVRFWPNITSLTSKIEYWTHTVKKSQNHKKVINKTS